MSKIYRVGELEVPALHEVQLEIGRGAFVAVMGPSGSGKSTLLTILGCLTSPTGGEYWLNGEPVAGLSPNALAEIRNRLIGFVFQQFFLLPRLTAVENVEIPMVYAGAPKAERRRRAEALLERVGLGRRLHHLPSQLSGGEQQRVAIARSLTNQPKLLLADEPTGNLDSHVGAEIMALLKELSEQGMTIVLVTHHEPFAREAHRTVRLRDGRLVSAEEAARVEEARPAPPAEAPLPASPEAAFGQEPLPAPAQAPVPPGGLPFDF